tara:strand:+ start:36 stop:413 length:378 start_codon:yes stop_codon:yes gene_type:complete
MAFKIEAPYKFNHVPVYRTLDEDGVLGIATKNGAIRISKDIDDPAQLKSVVAHELVHYDQMMPNSNDTGRFGYDNEHMFFKPKGSSKTITTKRSEKVDGAHYLAHEKEASNPKVQKKIKNKYNEL